MSGILVIGGYGGFGARLCRRLAASGHRILIGGRNAEKAARLCAGMPGAEPVALDRNSNLAETLARHRPDLVIDAAGPFQASGYGVPEACIEARIPYLDLADARDFVLGVSALDGRARAAGVAIVSGASSVPALSGAVARRLADGLDSVESVEIALSVSNRASGGASVVAAILSYVGKPVRLWRGRHWASARGWQEMKREDFLLPDGSGMNGRLVAIADVPDCELLPTLLPGRPAVTFRAGTELRFQMIALWLASWPVRWGWLRSLRGAAPWLLRLYRLTLGLGGARSGMNVTLTGRSGGARIERRWTLVAEKGEGLHVPTLAAALLAEDAIDGRLAPGARTAASLLTLERFEPAFAALALRHATEERPLPPPLYARVLGPAFETLPPAVRRLHDICRDSGAAGEAEVARGTSAAARLLSAIMRFPPAGPCPLHVAFGERAGVETWTRDFGGHLLSSRLSEGRSGEVVERFGPIRFAFALSCGPEGLGMHLRRWSLFRLPLPLLLAPCIAAREWEEEGRFRFDVAVSMPLVRQVIRYSGWLSPIG